MELYIYKTLIDNIDKHLISLIQSDIVFEKGLEGKSVIGYLKDPTLEVSKDNIIYNQNFVEIFQASIESAAMQSSELAKSAKQQQNGYIYIIDQRAINKGDTKQYDILGAFLVENGQITLNSFQTNPNYEIISCDGLFKLPLVFEQNIIKAITT